MSHYERFDAIRDLCPRYIIVRDSPPLDAGFVLLGHVNALDELNEVIEQPWRTIADCKPGIWRVETRRKPEEERQPDRASEREVCLRWVGALEAGSDFDFASDVESWRSWDTKMRERFPADPGVLLDDGDLVWKGAGAYCGGISFGNIISAEYLTTKAAGEIIHGKKGGAADDGKEEVDEEQDGDGEMVGFYLETITLNEEYDWDPNGRLWDTLGGVHCESYSNPP